MGSNSRVRRKYVTCSILPTSRSRRGHSDDGGCPRHSRGCSLPWGPLRGCRDTLCPPQSPRSTWWRSPAWRGSLLCGPRPCCCHWVRLITGVATSLSREVLSCRYIIVSGGVVMSSVSHWLRFTCGRLSAVCGPSQATSLAPSHHRTLTQTRALWEDDGSYRSISALQLTFNGNVSATLAWIDCDCEVILSSWSTWHCEWRHLPG